MNNMGLEEYKGVFIYAQQVDNELSSIAFELIGKAKELAKDLGTDVTAVLLGSNVKGLTDELGECGIAAAREVETTMPVKAPTDIKPACPKESSPKMPTVRFKEIAMTM